MNDEQTEVRVTGVETWERIANALERIADALDGKTEHVTPLDHAVSALEGIESSLSTDLLKRGTWHMTVGELRKLRRRGRVLHLRRGRCR